jgi:hypothetical protein
MVAAASSVPGSMFHASYSFGVSLKNWSWLPQISFVDQRTTS